MPEGRENIQSEKPKGIYGRVKRVLGFDRDWDGLKRKEDELREKDREIDRRVGIPVKKTEEPKKPKPDIIQKELDINGKLEDKELQAEIDAAKVEIERNPDRAKKILDELDADAMLFRQILESRKGVVGKYHRLAEKLTLHIKGKDIKIIDIVGGAAAATILEKALVAYKIANPIVGGITGGALGGLRGYIYGRQKQESVKKWMSELDIIGKNPDELKEMSPEELTAAIGIIDNAVRGKKVRGKPLEQLELARKYRMIRNILAEKARTDGIGIEKIDKMSKTEEDFGKNISAAASEKYKKLYEEILVGKRKQLWASALKGAAIGATVGTLVGWLSDKIVSHGQAEQLAGKEQGLRTEHLQHQQMVDQYRGQPHTAEEYNFYRQSDNFEIIRHAEELAKIPGAHPGGFTEQGLAHFDTMLHAHSSLDHLTQEAGINNIDLSAAAGNSGQKLGEFILSHRGEFLNLSVESQRHILSFPQLAPEIFATATAGGISSTAVIAPVAGAVGLAAIGFAKGRTGRKYTEELFRTHEIPVKEEKKKPEPAKPVETKKPEEKKPEPTKEPEKEEKKEKTEVEIMSELIKDCNEHVGKYFPAKIVEISFGEGFRKHLGVQFIIDKNTYGFRLSMESQKIAEKLKIGIGDNIEIRFNKFTEITQDRIRNLDIDFKPKNVEKPEPEPEPRRRRRVRKHILTKNLP
ncbi:MAG: hypothetical protein NTW79_04500 [Candidatus Berkelbacteria bacterium]|nr:hypothetical protein [Candidatus Berkelbacteria bacterium]